MTTTCGIFYGVGLGPGEPELITLKALKVLQHVHRIYTVTGRQSRRSVSTAIIAALPGVTAELMELEFTMSRNWQERLAHIDAHAVQIAARLEAGEDCAFGTIGDPMTYSTCSYLLDALKRRLPQLKCEIIPGVNSWSALAAAAQMPLSEDLEELRVVPGYTLADGLPECSQKASTVFLKTYRTRNALLGTVPPDAEILYGENVGLADQFVSSDRNEIIMRPNAYLSQIIVKRRSEK